MSVRFQMTEDDLKENGFSHTGLAFGLVPVYINGIYDPVNETLINPILATRNWVPDFVLDFVHELAFLFCPNPNTFTTRISNIKPIKFTEQK